HWYNEPPLAVDDGYGLCADTSLAVPAPGVLANDSDPEGDPISATMVVSPAHGSAALQLDGALTYTPTLGYNGSDSLVYAAVDAYGAATTATVALTVSAGTAAGFVDNTPVCPGETAVFTNTTGGIGPFTYLWAFGDGATSTQEHPTHVYAAAGFYTVTLVATGTCGVDAVSRAVEISGPPGMTDFTWVPVNPAVGQVLTLTGSAVGLEPITYTWNLGDGALLAGRVITHSYAATGTYPVVMTATNSCGPAVVSHTVTVVLTPTCTPVEILAVTTVISGCQAAFTAQLWGDPPFAYLWAFGDGMTSTAAMPAHNYGASGTYSGTLAVGNCGGEGYDEQPFAVTVECVPSGHAIFLPLAVREE
ncbi:MAG: PKD domain-containing protein, partial [Anaerolineae bacterium]|nr:PKD domain-containing protein [Anaerolineae bacterium]